MGLVEHIEYENGNRKTVCVTNVLTALGIPLESYRITWNGKKNTWADILRRNGFSVRSRKSYLPKDCSVGRARREIQKLIISGKDPMGTLYAISTGNHLILLSNEGKTLIDTAPRKRDRRPVVVIVAITRKSQRRTSCK